MCLSELIIFLYNNFLALIFENELLTLSIIMVLIILMTLKDLLVIYIHITNGPETNLTTQELTTTT